MITQNTSTTTTTTGIDLALGTVQFGLAYGVVGSGQPVGDAEVRRILDRAAALGIRVLDTAAAYGDIEQRLAGLSGANAFSAISKIPPLWKGAEAPAAAAFVRKALTASQTRLGSMLGSVLFHSADDLLGPLGEALWKEAARFTTAGGLRLGVSCYGPQQLQAVAERFPVALAQLPGNALDQRLNGFSFPGIELHLRSAFLQGLLLAPAEQGGQRLPAAASALRQWQHHCEQQDLSPLTAALGAVKALPGVRYCVVGVESVAQLEQIAAAWQQARPLALPELATDDPAIIDPRVWKKAA
ncbi:aldo/keto reductase [Aquabacterium sp.]|uniref:aldo/keto reductase n=1 Tax=Aquabacterium sp. TaxID=1872578 RepID=UPI002C74EA9A|nr:aldo/keto reductase [Aquabacterium sp.]HSW04741.1 aldo/keto reductase [Aquabacterium sp.]